MADYSLKSYFGGKGTEAYQKYKAGQKAGKWADLPDYVSQGRSASSSNTGYENLMNQQKGEETAALSKFEGILAGQPSVESEFGRIGQEYDLSGKRDLASKLASEYGGIEGSTTTHGRQFGMSSSQIARRVAALQGKKAPQLQEAQRIAGEAQGQVGERLNLAWQDLEKELRPMTQEFSFLKDRLAREATGFSEQMQRNLDMSLQKLMGGQALEQEELAQAGRLALAEQKYEISKRKDSGGTGLLGLDEEEPGSGGGTSDSKYDQSSTSYVPTLPTQQFNPFGIGSQFRTGQPTTLNRRIQGLSGRA